MNEYLVKVTYRQGAAGLLPTPLIFVRRVQAINPADALNVVFGVGAGHDQTVQTVTVEYLPPL